MRDGQRERIGDWVALLGRAFDIEFNIFDAVTGELVYAAASQPQRDWSTRAELCREVARRSQAEFIDEEDPLLVLAIPLDEDETKSLVAVATLLSRPLEEDEDLSAAARSLMMRPGEVADWARRQRPWTPAMVRKVAAMVLERLADNRRISELLCEAHSLSEHVSSTHEEISLLYRLTQNLKLSQGDQQLGQSALEWLAEVVPAKSLVLLLHAPPNPVAMQAKQAASDDSFLTVGDCPVGRDEFAEFIKHIELDPAGGPLVANRPFTEQPSWSWPAVEQFIVVPLAEGNNLFGWLAAINHVEGGDFSSVDAGLMSSVGTLLGIHGSNIDLYRQQSEMFAGIVRALASAIDAKDEYTRGHSHRVARVSVRLATELGCDEKTVGRIYLAGLLHDIGKIGVDDTVLRKPGPLSVEEYEHIKQHVAIGHRILVDLSKMEDVLPVVLYHHEWWDGTGYPHHLPAHEIPLAARIVAVADAFDAMSSDRPYRQGLPDDQIDAIFRDGAGRQWDPAVVDAFFRARDEIREIVRRERVDLEDDLQWFAWAVGSGQCSLGSSRRSV